MRDEFREGAYPPPCGEGRSPKRRRRRSGWGSKFFTLRILDNKQRPPTPLAALATLPTRGRVRTASSNRCECLIVLQRESPMRLRGRTPCSASAQRSIRPCHGADVA